MDILYRKVKKSHGGVWMVGLYVLWFIIKRFFVKRCLKKDGKCALEETIRLPRE